MASIEQLLEDLGCVPGDWPADYITFQGITNVTGDEIAAWVARRKLTAKLPGVTMASAERRPITVLFPPDLRQP